MPGLDHHEQQGRPTRRRARRVVVLAAVAALGLSGALTAPPANAAPRTGLTGTGLLAEYFPTLGLQGTPLTRVERVNLRLGSGSPAEGIGPDRFSVRWTGDFEVTASGPHTFTTRADDGVRLWVDGNLVIDDWTDHAVEERSATVDLVAGRPASLRLEYFENTGYAVARLFFTAPGQSRTLVPATRLYTPEPDAPAEPTAPPVTPTPSPPVEPTTPPTTPSASAVDVLVDDMKLGHDARPADVPEHWDWAQGPVVQMGNNPQGWRAMTGWGQVYEAKGGNPAGNTRVELRDIETWLLSRSTGRWTRVQYAERPGGAAYRSDFAGDVNKPADARVEPSGGLGVKAGGGYNYHFWPADRADIDPDDVGGVVTRVRGRLVVDDATKADDRGQARYILSMGGDYWASQTAVWDNFTTNGGIGVGRFKWVTSDWQSFGFHTLTEEQLRQNPPPLG